MVVVQNASVLETKLNEFLLPANRSGWLLVKYVDDTTIAYEASGAGDVEEFKAHLRDGECQYALVRLRVLKDGNEATRDVLLSWFGPELSRIKRSKRKADEAFIRSVLQPNHAQVDVLSREKLTTATLIDRSAPLSGSHVIE